MRKNAIISYFIVAAGLLGAMSLASDAQTISRETRLVQAGQSTEEPTQASQQAPTAFPPFAQIWLSIAPPRVIQIVPESKPKEGSQCVRKQKWLGFLAYWNCMVWLFVTPEKMTAIFTVVLGISTIGLWFSTRRLSRLAEVQSRDMKISVAAAQSAAQSASSQVAISREALIAADRAFVYCDHIDSKWTAKKDNEEIVRWTFTPIWKNSGRTPTKNALGYAGNWVGINSGAIPDDFEYNKADSAAPIALAPGTIRHTLSLDVDVEKLQQIRGGSGHAYIFGWIDYDDVFSMTDRHRSEFCVEIVVIGNPIYKEGGFAYRGHGCFNGSDTDCSCEPNPYRATVQSETARG